MMEDVRFTPAQRHLIEAGGSMFVEACPGAGKTQAIVERFMTRMNVSPRKGIALLSFSNAAADEARRRCSGNPSLLTSPNFIGTIDSFINRFIVGPLYREHREACPTFKESWEGHQGATFKVGRAPRWKFSLHWFSFSRDGSARLEHDRIPRREHKVWGPLNRWQEAAATAEAAKIYKMFSSNDIMATDDSRRWLWQFMDDSIIGDQIAVLLGNRFDEVIVDEVQDSNSEDIRLLTLLRDAGIDIVMVGDMDQAIYGFRHVERIPDTSIVNQLRSKQRLADNFRSSPAICCLANSLRSTDYVDAAAGANKNVAHPIVLISFSGNDLKGARSTMENVLTAYTFDRSNSVVLAYQKEHARTLAGDCRRSSQSESKFVLIARELTSIRNETGDPRDRWKSIVRLLALFRELSGSERLMLPDADFYAAIGVNERQLREGIVRMAYGLDCRTMAPSEFKSRMIGFIERLGWNTWVNTSGLRKPPGDVWEDDLQPGVQPFKWSSVHSFKGLQSPAVALVIPKGSSDHPCGVEAWKAGVADEARRVLYVGATRAERLLVLVAHVSRSSDIVGCLMRDQVPYTVA